MYKAEYEVLYDEGFEHVHHDVKFESENVRMVCERLANYCGYVENTVDQFDNAYGTVILWCDGDILMMEHYDSNTGTWS